MTFLAAGQAIGLQLTVAQGALLTSGVALVTIVPSGPGFVGTFELTVVAIADQLGIPRDAAFALGLLVHVMILGTTTIGGVIALATLRRRDKAVSEGDGATATTGATGGTSAASTGAATVGSASAGNAATAPERLGEPGGEPTR